MSRTESIPAKFTPVVCEFLPGVDLEEVDQFGFVDLREAFLHGNMPGDVSTDSEAYNGIDDPDSIMNRASDQFESIRQAEYIKGAESASLAEAKVATSGGSE